MEEQIMDSMIKLGPWGIAIGLFGPRAIDIGTNLCTGTKEIIKWYFGYQVILVAIENATEIIIALIK